MKTSRLSSRRPLSMALLAGIALVGCGVDREAENQEIISNLIESGYPADDIMIHEGAVYVGRDAHVTLEASREMLQTSGSQEQYRTNNLVGFHVSKICINPTAAFNSYPKFIYGLDLAIQNYNEHGRRIYFVRGPTTGCTANITAEVRSGDGGDAGYPSGGYPYGIFFIGTLMNDNYYPVDTVEHVITHELGHTIGFRHSDCYNRSISCTGAAINEGDEGVGSVLIPGTPAVATWGGSLMNSCYRQVETGEFTSTDLTALYYLY
ncbi:MAG TPA: M57 family metalloprotease [Archangium sp.]|uniref:M57 family metalloprotease n=1 Tax=Archangium sp. TaxID=1872627 RepID=UPI002E32D009|nr:M57 family metalloprotease [Archangium sp.]HEX5746969.1 M57 family metalloprotease [Archangium sp.]